MWFIIMVISSLFLDLVFPLFPMYEGSRMIAALSSGAFIGAGMALFYIRGSSSGGIDFLALAVKKKKPHITIGVITLLIDLVVILLGWPVFGDVDAVLYGILATVVSTVVIDKILYGTGAGTLAIIITRKGDCRSYQQYGGKRRDVIKGCGNIYGHRQRGASVCLLKGRSIYSEKRGAGNLMRSRWFRNLKG